MELRLLPSSLRSQLEEFPVDMIQKLVREVGAEALRRQLVIDDHITGAFEGVLSYARPELLRAEMERLPGRAEAQGILFLAQAEKLLANPKLEDRVELLKWMAEWTAETLKQFDMDHSNWLRNMQKAREKAKEKGQPVKADPVKFSGGPSQAEQEWMDDKARGRLDDTW